VRAHVQGDPRRGGGLQQADLTGDPPVGPPALADQGGVLVGASDPQRGQVQVQPGSVHPEPLDRRQHERPADLLGDGRERVQCAAEPIVVEQCPWDLEDLGHGRRAGPARDVVQRGGRGEPVGDQRGHDLAVGELGAAALWQLLVDDAGQAEPVQVAGDQQQWADIPAGPGHRRVQAVQRRGELVELARLFELVLTAQRVEDPMADLAVLVPVGFHQPQVDVLGGAAADDVALDVHVGPTLRQPRVSYKHICSPSWPYMMDPRHPTQPRHHTHHSIRPLCHKASRPTGIRRAPFTARRYPHNVRKTGLADAARAILRLKRRAHELVGEAIAEMFESLVRELPRFQRLLVRKLTERLPLPWDVKLEAIVRGIQVVGIWMCVVQELPLEDCPACR